MHFTLLLHLRNCEHRFDLISCQEDTFSTLRALLSYTTEKRVISSLAGATVSLDDVTESTFPPSDR
jgi:hypothetical protein